MVGTLGRSPFPRLVKHFLRRIQRSGTDKVVDGAEIGVGPLLGLLIAPGAVHCFLSMEKYSSLMSYFRSQTARDLIVDSIPDKLLLISISMAMTGVVCVLKWDRLLLDRQDYVNLAPLPMRRSMILAANAVSMALIAVGINGAVNVASCLLFPAIVSAAAVDGSIAFGQFFWAHVAVVALASVFAFVFVMAALSTTALVAGRRLAGAAVVVRVGLMVGLVLLVPAALKVGALWRLQPGNGWLAWFAPLWFLDLYQELQSRGPVGRASLVSMVWQGTAVSLVAAMVGCGLLNRSQFSGNSSPQARVSSRWFLRGLVWGGGKPFERAVREFTVYGLLQNDPQRLVVLVGLGVGWLAAGLSLERNPAAPLIPAYLLVVALRVAFQLPTELSANWMFRVTLDRSVRPIGAAVTKTAVRLAGAFVLLPTAALLAFSGRRWSDCVLILALVGCMNWAHLEVVFGRWRFIPFTRPPGPFRQSLPVRCILEGVAFAAFVWVGASAYGPIVARPAKLAPLVLLCLYVRWWNRSQLASEVADGDVRTFLEFEDSDGDGVQTLGLR